MESIESRNKRHRKSFTFTTGEWQLLKNVAVEKGYKNRNQFLIQTLRRIIADHLQSKADLQQAKSHD